MCSAVRISGMSVLMKTKPAADKMANAMVAALADFIPMASFVQPRLAPEVTDYPSLLV
jgi:hypothetical protein